MGQHADDMLEGLVCQECGEFFDDILNGGEEPGYPRTCDRCSRSAAPQRQGKKLPTPPQPMTPERVAAKVAKARAKKARNRANRAARATTEVAP